MLVAISPLGRWNAVYDVSTRKETSQQTLFAMQLLCCACRLSGRIVQRCEGVLRPGLQRLLSQLVTGELRVAVLTNKPQRAAEVLVQVGHAKNAIVFMLGV
jgi:phosphoglycolate phosphatase-like HAD superfamily hydrolase